MKARDALEAVGSVSRVGRVRVLSVYERPCDIIALASAHNKQESNAVDNKGRYCCRWLGGVSYGEETQGNRAHEFEGGDRSWSHDGRSDCAVRRALLGVFLRCLLSFWGNVDGMMGLTVIEEDLTSNGMENPCQLVLCLVA